MVPVIRGDALVQSRADLDVCLRERRYVVFENAVERGPIG